MMVVIGPLLLIAVFAYPVGWLVHERQAPGARFVGKRQLKYLRWAGSVIVVAVYAYGSLTEPTWWTDGDGNALVAATVINIAYLTLPAMVRFVLPVGAEE